MSKSTIEIYTDGSCIPFDDQETIASWVAIIFLEEEKIVLKHTVRNTTHNRMELLAVIHAVEFVMAHNRNDLPMVVYSDSQYVVNLKKRKEKLKEKNFLTKKGGFIQNADLVRSLIQLIEINDVCFVKVKAHQKTGNTNNFNRETDILSRKMARDYLSDFQAKGSLIPE